MAILPPPRLWRFCHRPVSVVGGLRVVVLEKIWLPRKLKSKNVSSSSSNLRSVFFKTGTFLSSSLLSDEKPGRNFCFIHLQKLCETSPLHLTFLKLQPKSLNRHFTLGNPASHLRAPPISLTAEAPQSSPVRTFLIGS